MSGEKNTLVAGCSHGTFYNLLRLAYNKIVESVLKEKIFDRDNMKQHLPDSLFGLDFFHGHCWYVLDRYFLSWLTFSSRVFPEIHWGFRAITTRLNQVVSYKDRRRRVISHLDVQRSNLLFTVSLLTCK